MPKYNNTEAQDSSRVPSIRRVPAKHLLLLFAGVLLCAAPLCAQSLAHRGWSGSGLAPRTWWHNGVFYQLDDNTQLTKDELPSLQAFGIDALVLPSTPATPSSPAVADSASSQPLSVDDLFFECSRLHMRVLVPLDVAAGTSDSLLALAKSWLYRGAAGFVLLHLSAAPSTTPEPVANSSKHHHRTATTHTTKSADLPIVIALKALLTKFPGDHILIADDATASPSISLHLVTLPDATAPGADVTSRTMLSLAADRKLTPLDAARLLLTPAAVEIHSDALPPASLLRVFPPLAAPPPPPPPPEKPVSHPPSDVYGTFVPYVPKDTTAERAAEAKQKKIAAEEAAIAAATFPVQSDYDPILHTTEGLIAYYQRLVQLHHTAQALIDGDVRPLDAPQPALAWAITRRGVPPMVVVVNPSASPQTFDMTTALHGITTPRLAFRTLSHTAASSGVVHPDKMEVGPNGVYAGELVPGYVYR